MAILKIEKTPITLTIRKAKVVEGKFGNQLWASVVNDSGEEHVVYLPWANKDGNMSGVVQQFVRAGVMGPEDFSGVADTPVPEIEGRAYTFERVFKDGNQFINIKTALRAAADTELGLEEATKKDTAAFLGAARSAPPLTPPVAKKPREAADARIKRAWDHVMETYGAELAEMDGNLARALVALTATHAIAYEHEA